MLALLPRADLDPGTSSFAYAFGAGLAPTATKWVWRATWGSAWRRSISQGRGCLLASGVGQTATFGASARRCALRCSRSVTPVRSRRTAPPAQRRHAGAGIDARQRTGPADRLGFKPDSSVMMGSAAAPVVPVGFPRSRSQPGPRRSQPDQHVVSSRDGSTAMRRDLFRFSPTR